MWDSQGGVPFNGDFPMNYNTVYAIELNTKVFIEEWNKEIELCWEAGTFEETGFRYVNGRQTKLILIGDQRVHLEIKVKSQPFCRHQSELFLLLFRIKIYHAPYLRFHRSFSL